MDELSFIGFATGPAFSASIDNLLTSGLAGFTLFNGDLLPGTVPNLRNLLTDDTTIPSPQTSINGGAPLGAGTYTFLVQETTSALEVDYQLDFLIEIAPVPEPSSTALFALSSLVFLARRKRVS